MSSSNGQRLTGFSMLFLLAGGMVMLALLVLAPDYAHARLDGSQPVPIQSELQADYSKDPIDLVIQPVDVKVVEQVIISHTTSTSLPPKQQAATSIGALQTPVYTITPTPVQTNPPASSPTRTSQNPTRTVPAFTPTGATGSTKIVPSTPTGVVLTEISTQTPTLNFSATRPVSTISPSFTRTGTATATITPRPNTTIIPSPIGSTFTPSPKPTITPKPTFTPTWTLPPVTTVVSVQPPTSTFTPTQTYTPTPTRTNTSTRTYTPTPTRTHTSTFTPTRTPTAVIYPPPPTNTPVSTLPPYP